MTNDKEEAAEIVAETVRRQNMNPALSQGEQGAMSKEAKLTVATFENERMVKHLKRLRNWASQDPTGPREANGVKAWVMNEIDMALGSIGKEVPWKPESISD